jgi:hypothetical protein
MLARVFLSIKERAGARNSSINEMPRNKQGGALASYFYNAMGEGVRSQPEPGNAAAPVTRTKSSFLPTTPARLAAYDEYGNWIGPGPEPKKGKRRRSKKTTRPSKPHASHIPTEDKPKSEGVIRHEHKIDLQNKVASMKKHFSETDRLLERNDKWPMHYTHSRVTFYIGQCKDVIKKARSHTGPGSHKANAEAVHSKHLHETDGWSFKAIHSDIHQYSESVGIKNHLTLDKPLTEPGDTGMYVNVVLAWLFAAKRQLMTTLAKFIDEQSSKSADMIQFLEENNKGVNARRAYRTDKTFLGAKHHARPYDLHDKALLAKQHAILYV